MTQPVEEVINEYLERILRRDQFHELEIRLGKAVTNPDGSSKFDTLIKRKRYFDLMDRYDDLGDFLEEKDMVFFEKRKKRVRVRFDRDGNLLESIKKTKRNEKVVEQKGQLHDLRFSIAKEEPTENIVTLNRKDSTRKRRKKYTYPYCEIDFTLTNRGRYSDHRIEIELKNSDYNKNEFGYIKKELLLHVERLNS